MLIFTPCSKPRLSTAHSFNNNCCCQANSSPFGFRAVCSHPRAANSFGERHQKSRCCRSRGAASTELGMGSGKTRLWLRPCPLAPGLCSHEQVNFSVFFWGKTEATGCKCPCPGLCIQDWCLRLGLQPFPRAQLLSSKLSNNSAILLNQRKQIGKEINPFHLGDFSPNVAESGQQKLEQNHPFPLPTPLYARFGVTREALISLRPPKLLGSAQCHLWVKFKAFSLRSSLQPQGIQCTAGALDVNPLLFSALCKGAVSGLHLLIAEKVNMGKKSF